MSRPVLYRKLKQLTGLSIIDFINQIRFKMAASLLKMGNLSVVDVANRVGFADPKHFRKSFKLFFGCNPSEYSKISEKITENV
ncbi:helix-turn-helix domain-containing protein [Lunatibacter salilacus]|uniref:helix-turn-helix domain-containing protein n=1 Tax=Lunatibacter salilacus TaxID=2483804 RepID=UPI00131C4C11